MNRIFASGCTAAFAITVLTTVVPSRNAHAQIAFENVSSAAGFINVNSDTWGASWGDLDGDHYPDIFLSNHFSRAALYRNNRDGTFTNVSAQVDLSKTPGWTGGRAHVDTHGSTWGDLDNDGDEDLYESVSSGVDNVWINDNGLLTLRSVQWGVDHLITRSLRQNLLFDYNGDGLLDLASIGLRDPGLAPQVAGGGSFGYGSGVEVPVNCPGDAQWGHFVDVDPMPGLELLCAPRGQPYPGSVSAFKNGKLVDVSAGFRRWNEVNDAATFDYDRDLRPDIFMVRRSERPSDVYQATPSSLEVQLITAPNRTKSIRFKTTGALTIKASMSGSGDNDREGNPQDIDIGATGWSPTSLTFTLQSDAPSSAGILSGAPGINIGYMTATGEWVISQGPNGHHYAYVQVGSTTPITGLSFKGASASDIGYTPVLAHNTAAGFVDVSGAGFNSPLRCQSVVAGDFDNDMDEDLFLVCTAGSYNLPDRLFANNGDGTFTEVANGGGAAGPTGAAVADRAGAGESVVTADYDVDGFLDLFVTNGNNMRPVYTGGPEQLFHNLGNANHWIELDLVGTVSNRDAVGSQVYVTSGGVTQYREQNGGYHRWSQNFMRVHVGLGANTQADVKVRWPDGTETEFPALAANTLYQVKQDGTFAALMSGTVSTDSDSDGLSDDREAVLGTDAHNPDSDADGLNDGDEVARKTNPLLADTDGEGLKDGDEVQLYGTNPLVKDTDKDTLSDKVEVVFKHTDPLNPDTDGDGLTDGKEAGAQGLGTNPLNPDTDGGGVNDGTEVSRGTDPKNPADD